MRAPLQTLLLLAATLIASAPAALGATSFVEAGRRLDGRWSNDSGFVLKVDATRAQASVDAQRPFQWQRFLVKSVDGQSITFSIGSDVFEATLSKGAMTLTGTSFRGAEALKREVPQAIAPAAPELPGLSDLRH